MKISGYSGREKTQKMQGLQRPTELSPAIFAETLPSVRKPSSLIPVVMATIPTLILGPDSHPSIFALLCRDLRMGGWLQVLPSRSLVSSAGFINPGFRVIGQGMARAFLLESLPDASIRLLWIPYETANLTVVTAGLDNVHRLRTTQRHELLHCHVIRIANDDRTGSRR